MRYGTKGPLTHVLQWNQLHTCCVGSHRQQNLVVGAGEGLAAPGEADSAVKSKRLELGLLASLANDPGVF